MSDARYALGDNVGGHHAKIMHWLRHHIAHHRGDSTRLVILGHSSGCLLASVIGTDSRYLAAQQLGLSSLRGVVAMGCTLSPVMPAIADSARLRAVFTSGALWTFGSLEEFLNAVAPAWVTRRRP